MKSSRKATVSRQAYSRMAKDRWLAAGVNIPSDTLDVRLAIKREIWSRGLSAVEVAKRIGLAIGANGHAGMLSSVLGGEQRLTPELLNRIIEAVHITPKVARRLHYLGAIEAGWNVAELRSGARVTQDENEIAPLPTTHSATASRQIYRLTP